MPHQTTYFFPRQFPDRRFDESTKQLLNHEKKITKETIQRTVENDSKSSSRTSTTKDLVPAKQTYLFDLFTDEKFHAKKQQLVALCNWLTEKNGDRSSTHVKSSRHPASDEDHELLLPPESAPPPSETKLLKDSREERTIKLVPGDEQVRKTIEAGRTGEEDDLSLSKKPCSINGEGFLRRRAEEDDRWVAEKP